MTTATSKLPANDRPLIQDPDLAAALERELEPLSGKSLERAQAAVRRIHGSALQAPFGTVLAAYQTAIAEAVATRKEA